MSGLNFLDQTDPGDETQPPMGACPFCGARTGTTICAACDAVYEREARDAYEQGLDDT